MLEVSTLRSSNEESKGELEGFQLDMDDFSEVFTGGIFLEGIDFDDLFVGIEDGDVLPELEMDPEMLAEFSVSGGEESSEVNASVSVGKVEENEKRQEEDKDKEIVSKKKDEAVAVNPSGKEDERRKRKSSSTTYSKGSQGKRKVKVDWTPELHRRFVQAVEQLGVDKAVPSRILELMGIDCLTRHNIASHLQKYRSHRKHLLAREAEAASWSQRRQIHGGVGVGGGSKRDINPWLVPPTMGFPPPLTPLQPFRPLHVWGHPTVDQSVMRIWPKHLVHAPPPPWPSPPPPPPPPDPSYWQQLHHQLVKGPNALTPGTPCLPQPLATTRFSTTPIRAVPPQAMYKVDQVGMSASNGQTVPLPPFDFHPSKESIDAAVGDVLSKPWLPLPLGLKPPSVESVIVELQNQGIPKIPLTCA